MLSLSSTSTGSTCSLKDTMNMNLKGGLLTSLLLVPEALPGRPEWVDCFVGPKAAK